MVLILDLIYETNRFKWTHNTDLSLKLSVLCLCCLCLNLRGRGILMFGNAIFIGSMSICAELVCVCQVLMYIWDYFADGRVPPCSLWFLEAFAILEGYVFFCYEELHKIALIFSSTIDAFQG